MKKFRKLTAWFVAFVMLMTIMPGFTLTASAAEPEYDGVIGELYYKNDDENGTTTIFGNGALTSGMWITEIYSNVVIEEGVTSIEATAFRGCSSLETLTVKGDITAIGNLAFQGCSSLTTLTFMGNVTAVGSNVFRNCDGLSTIYYHGTTEPESNSTLSDIMLYSQNGVSFCGLTPSGSSTPETPTTYTVTISDSIENGTVEADVSEAEEGDTVTLTITPNEGYALKTLTVDGEDVTENVTDNKYTFLMPAAEVVVTATFAQVYSVTRSVYAGYTINRTADTVLPIKHGDSYAFTVEITDGYEKTAEFAVKAGNREDDASALTALTPDENGVYTITNITSDKKIQVVGVSPCKPDSIDDFKADENAPFKLVCEADESHSITVPYFDSAYVIVGDINATTRLCEITYNVGKYLEDKLPGHRAEGYIPNYITVQLRWDEEASKWAYASATRELTVTCGPETYDIRIASNSKGPVTSDKTEAAEGETVTITLTPAEGYAPGTLRVEDESGEDVPVTNSTFTMPASFVTVYATFVEVPPTPAEVQFEVVKEINNWDAESSFTFNLQAVTAGAPMPENTSAVATKDMPSARFEAIIYDEMGTYVYTIREVQGAVPGMSYDTSAHEVVVDVTKGEDNKLYATVTYDGEDELIITNTYTPPQSVRISAVDVASYAALEGAILRIIDDSGDVVEEWISRNEPHFVEGLRSNQTYTLRVFLPPDGYTVPDDANFVLYESGRIEYGGTTTTDDDGNVILLVAFNKTKAHISATDMDGDEVLEGATIQIINEDGYIVEEWVSFQEPRFVEGLTMNETYTLHVARPPAGYIVPADTTFSIDEKGRISYSGTTDTDVNDNTVLLIKHEISKVRISAVDMEDGSALADATLQIIDDRGNLVEEWVSHGGYQEIKGLNVDEAFTLHAETAPNGFTKFNDVTFRINKKGELVTAGMVTEDGVLLAGFVPIGFTIKAEHTFDVETRGDITVQIWNSDEEIVAARTLAEFTDRKWKLEGFPADEDYTVRIKDVPWGYAKPADIHVFIGSDGNVTVNGAESADGVVLITFEEISPVIEEIVFDSDNEAYDAETNTFYYDSQHTLNLVINGQDLIGQKIYVALENSAGNHLGFYNIATEDTKASAPLNKATLDETLDSFAMQDMTADIVKIRAEITGSPDAPTYLELNVKPRKYSITLDSNGADTASVTLDTDYRKLTSLPTPERVGYAFNGWFDAQIGGNEITTDTVFEQDTTIYAQWTKLIPKITGIAIDATSSAYDAATDTFTVFKDKPFVVFLEGENFINIDDEFLETNAFGFVPSVEDSENALGNALAVFKDTGFVTIDAVENRIKLTFDYDAMKSIIAEHGSFEGICYGDIVNIKEENIESVNIALAKYDPIYTEPTVKTDLVYNGAEQELLIPGTAEGGTMKYYIGGTEATAEVPTRKAAGEYTVTCIIAGDQFHNNIVVGEYTVSIAKKTIDNAISLTAPVKNATPQTEITGSCYTATVTWSPEVTDKFGYNTEYTATVTITPDENHTVAGVATNGYTVEGAKTVTNDENSNIVTVAYEKTGSRPSFGGGGSSNTTTTTTKNEDGSTTKVTENKTTGTKKEVTTNTDGSTTTVETKKDGTVTTTEKDKDGNTVTTVEKSDGTSTTTEKNKDGSEKVTEEKADGTTVTTEKDTDGTKTVTTEKADGSTTTEEVRKDGTEVKTETTTDGETTSEVKADGKSEVTIPVPDTEKVQMVVVTDENGNNTYITEIETNDNGVAVTTDGNATVSVMSGNKKEFVDVHHVDHWSEKSVDFVHILGLMNGTSENHFSPDVDLTRAMLVTVLYRAEGEPEITNDKSFVDVENGSYYEKAVAWAKANGIVNGTSATTFEPNVSITREQIAAIMHRYADFKGHDVSVGENTNILSYDDVHHVSEYAIGAMQYAVGSGLIKGKTESALNPLDNATRAEAAAILERFIKAN